MWYCFDERVKDLKLPHTFLCLVRRFDQVILIKIIVQ